MSFRTLTVAVDGSELALRAIPPAAAIARAAGASVTFVGVATTQDEVDSMTTHVADATRLVPEPIVADGHVVVDADPVAAILARTDDPTTVLCLASHDHLPAAAAVRRSVGTRLIGRARRPLLVVGPAADRSALADDVVVAIDGRHDPHTLLAEGATWADALHASLRVVTAYEPVLPDVRQPDHFTRTHGPSTDPMAYLQRVTRGLDDHGRRTVELAAVPDPVSVADGLAEHLDARPALVVVAGGHRRAYTLWPGVLRGLLGRAHEPVVVVPGPRQEPGWVRDANAAGVDAGGTP